MIREYIPVLLQIIVASGFAISALLVSVLLGKTGKRTRTKDSAYECGMVAQGEAQPRFSVYREMIVHSKLILWSMLSFVTVLMVGYVYALKKGAFDWKR